MNLKSGKLALNLRVLCRRDRLLVSLHDFVVPTLGKTAMRTIRQPRPGRERPGREAAVRLGIFLRARAMQVREIASGSVRPIAPLVY